jgi:hypothetical protein
MSFSHSQLLSADQAPKKRVFTRFIALVAMISGLLSFAFPFIFDFVSRFFLHMEPIVILSGPVAALVGIALGILALILEWNDPKTRRLGAIGTLTGVAWFIVVWILFEFVIRGIPLGPR